MTLVAENLPTGWTDGEIELVAILNQDDSVDTPVHIYSAVYVEGNGLVITAGLNHNKPRVYKSGGKGFNFIL